MSLKLGLYLGYWGIGPRGKDAIEAVQFVTRARAVDVDDQVRAATGGAGSPSTASTSARPRWPT